MSASGCRRARDACGAKPASVRRGDASLDLFGCRASHVPRARPRGQALGFVQKGRRLQQLGQGRGRLRQVWSRTCYPKVLPRRKCSMVTAHRITAPLRFNPTTSGARTESRPRCRAKPRYDYFPRGLTHSPPSSKREFSARTAPPPLWLCNRLLNAGGGTSAGPSRRASGQAAGPTAHARPDPGRSNLGVGPKSSAPSSAPSWRPCAHALSPVG